MTSNDPDFDPVSPNPPPRPFEVDQSRWEMLQSMFLSGLGKDNQKQVVKLINSKDRRISTVAKEKIQTLWASISEFKIMFNDQDACVMKESHYKEALVEILTQQSNQTACWKLSITESINPFSGKLIVGCWAAYGIQRRECQFFSDRADRLSADLRKEFRQVNGLLSEDDGSDDDSDHSDGDVDDQGRERNADEGNSGHREGENEGENDEDGFSECDDDFVSRLQTVNCDVMLMSSSPDPSKQEKPGQVNPLPENDQAESAALTVQEILDYEIQEPRYDWSADDPIPSLTEIQPVPNTPPRDRNSPQIPPPGESPDQNDLVQMNPNQTDPNRNDPDQNDPIITSGQPGPSTQADQAILKQLAQKYPTLKNLDKVDLKQDRPIFIRSPKFKPTPKSAKSFHREGKNAPKRKQNLRQQQRQQRDQVGCNRHFQQSLVQTREAEIKAARSWGRRSGVWVKTKEAPKRQHHFTPPMCKRGRSNESNELRHMSNQFQECLSLMTSQLDGFRQQVQNLNRSINQPQARNNPNYNLPDDLPAPINTKPNFYRRFYR